MSADPAGDPRPWAPEQITLARVIHRVDEPRHFMHLKPLSRRVCLWLADTLLTETTDAVRLVEVGRDVYDPVIYVPWDAVLVPLQEQPETRTHCPLKGDARYYDLLNDNGEVIHPGLAWAYREPLDGAEALASLLAFDPAVITVEEGPLAPG